MDKNTSYDIKVRCADGNLIIFTFKMFDVFIGKRFRVLNCTRDYWESDMKKDDFLLKCAALFGLKYIYSDPPVKNELNLLIEEFNELNHLENVFISNHKVIEYVLNQSKRFSRVSSGRIELLKKIAIDYANMAFRTFCNIPQSLLNISRGDLISSRQNVLYYYVITDEHSGYPKTYIYKYSRMAYDIDEEIESGTTMTDEMKCNLMEVSENVNEEFLLMNKFKNDQNIVKVYSFISNPTIQFYNNGILMEYCTAGSLYRFYKKYGDILTFKEFIQDLLTIAEVIKRISLKNILHRNITIHNIFVQLTEEDVSKSKKYQMIKSRSYTLKLADFGLACEIGVNCNQFYLLSRKLPNYSVYPPEAFISDYALSHSFDLYQYGRLIIKIFTEILLSSRFKSLYQLFIPLVNGLNTLKPTSRYGYDHILLYLNLLKTVKDYENEQIIEISVENHLQQIIDFNYQENMDRSMNVFDDQKKEAVMNNQHQGIDFEASQYCLIVKKGEYFTAYSFSKVNPEYYNRYFIGNINSPVNFKIVPKSLLANYHSQEYENLQCSNIIPHYSHHWTGKDYQMIPKRFIYGELPPSSGFHALKFATLYMSASFNYRDSRKVSVQGNNLFIIDANRLHDISFYDPKQSKNPINEYRLITATEAARIMGINVQ